MARAWVGRPYRPAGARECGVNCLGLFVAILREAGGFEDLAAAAEPHAGFARPPKSGALLRGLKDHLAGVPVENAGPGDLLLFRIGGEPQHLAILTEPGVILHADGVKGRVVEHRLPPGWRPVAAFRIPGVG